MKKPSQRNADCLERLGALEADAALFDKVNKSLRSLWRELAPILAAERSPERCEEIFLAAVKEVLNRFDPSKRRKRGRR